jgi:hypothetical protein
VKTHLQEPDVVASRPILWVIAATIAITAVSVWIARGLELGRRSAVLEDEPAQLYRMPAEVSAMETQTFTLRAQGLEDHRAAERRLSSYGWVDRDQNLIHLPIDVAIQLYLAGQERQP